MLKAPAAVLCRMSQIGYMINAVVSVSARNSTPPDQPQVQLIADRWGCGEGNGLSGGGEGKGGLGKNGAIFCSELQNRDRRIRHSRNGRFRPALSRVSL